MTPGERLARFGLRKPAYFVPGRIEVLGKHTDYAGGRSVLCAIDRGICMAVAPRTDGIVRATDVVRGETRELPLDAGAAAPRGDWANYVATVVRRVARNFPEARTGADVTFGSDLPADSGLSSSSALVVAVFLALDHVNRLAETSAYRRHIASPEDLATYLSSVEMGGGVGTLDGDAGVGTLGGSEDHTAILCCREDALSQYAFLPTRLEQTLPFPGDLAIVVAFSGVAAAKTGGALVSYNEASLALRRVLEIWNASSGRSDRTMADALHSSDDARARIGAALARAAPAEFPAKRLRERFYQFCEESEVVIPAASAAFSRGDLGAFGALVDRSQVMTEEWLGNQVPETKALVRLARECGAVAASAFGGGFGGSVWAMTARRDAPAFALDWRAGYARAYPDAAARADVFVTRPAAGARPIP